MTARFSTVALWIWWCCLCADWSSSEALFLVPRVRRFVQTRKFRWAARKGNRILKQKLPKEYHAKTLPLLKYFVDQYAVASQAAYRDGNKVDCAPRPAVTRILQAVGYGMKYGTGSNKYTFDVTHNALRGNPELENGNTIDYYAFGNDFFRPCMNLKKSLVEGRDHLQRALDQARAGENVVFFANHQSEADPQVVSCLFELLGEEKAGADMIFVAGHKVTTDPLAVPFSMGRNLICIHSKKHIDADPDTKSQKQRQNLRAMSALLDKFKKGGTLLWVAPSGGRDRRNVETGHVPLAPFDSKTLDIFRVMGTKSNVKTHYYTFAMVSYDLFPPPDTVVADVGEFRKVRYMPVGIAVGPELDASIEDRDEFCRVAYSQCVADYERLQPLVLTPEALALS